MNSIGNIFWSFIFDTFLLFGVASQYLILTTGQLVRPPFLLQKYEIVAKITESECEDVLF